MKHYDVIVIGNGSGSEIVQSGLMHDATVALVDIPPIGGTCQNFGCIPSKMLMYPADIITQINESKRLGIDASVQGVDFEYIMSRMREVRKESQDHQKRSINEIKNFDYYPGKATFVDNSVVQVNDTKIKAEKIFIGNGVRPLIPPIKGIENVPYVTNETILELEQIPESMIIIGGGYVAVEYAHFFSAMGADVTILEQGERLVSAEEPEVSDLLKESLQKRMRVMTDITVVEVQKKNGSLAVKGETKQHGDEMVFSADLILVAAGRIPNTDLLELEHTDINVDDQGFITVDEYLETTQSNTWAFGDVIGKHMFKHVANQEAYIAWNNAFHDEQIEMDYDAVPHAIFSHPQIASVGITQKDAESMGHDVLVGIARYDEVAKGEAMVERDGFAKAIVDKHKYKILGFHIIGPYAPMIIQEVITIMSVNGNVGHIGQAMHIHPSLPELIQRTFANLEEV